MKKTLYILLAAFVALTACRELGPDTPVVPRPAGSDLKVPIELNVAVPTDGPATKAMANDPQIKNIVVAVFGGSGYFNEWVPVENPPASEYATANEVIYKLQVKLSMSESRLRLHIIANCPEDLLNNPPITGVSSQDIEEAVMAKVRSKLTEANNDGYWQKVYLPYGIAAEIDPNGNGDNAYLLDEGGNLIPTVLTVSQFKMVSPIPLVRNFARIKLVNNASGVTISHIGVVYAPAEGTIAPMMSTRYKVDEWGARVSVVDDETSESSFTVHPVKADKDYQYSGNLPTLPDGATMQQRSAYYAQLSDLIGGLHVLGHELKDPDSGADRTLDATTGAVYDESFIINYQNLPLNQPENHSDWRLLTEAPYNYGGYAPTPLTFAPNPTSNTDGTPATGFTEYDPNGYVYVYERPKPRTISGKKEKATRLIIRAKNGDEPYKYYPLDIVDEEGNNIALLRNFTYTVKLAHIASQTGETDATTAADATGANVSDDPQTQDLNEVSDGTSSIIVSYIDTTAIQSGTYSVMYKYIPDVKTGQQSNKDVTFEVGYDGTKDGFVAGTQSNNGPTFAGTLANPSVSIEMDGSTPKLYVQDGNSWKVANTDAEKKEAWSKIIYTTVGTEGNAFTYNSNGTIRVTGTRNSSKIHRDVRVNIIQKKEMQVECAQKYVEAIAGKSEDLVIRIPDVLTRSMFPLEFKIQAADASITPRDGDNLPVSSGKSIVPNKESQSAFFFIKTLTKQEYDALPSVDGWKEFTCKFKTTKAASATTIYVSNPYFEQGSDDFKNYNKRFFTSDEPGNLGVGEEFEFTFDMDYAHRGGGLPLWNDDSSITNETRIIPREVKITLSGVSPVLTEDGHILDENLTYNDGYYYYEVPDDNGYPGKLFATLHLKADAEGPYSITLSTSTIEPNPELYDDYTVQGEIVKGSLDVTGFTNADGRKISSIGTAANLPVQFRFTYVGALVPVTFKLDGLVPDDARISGPDASGNYTFTPTGTEKAQVLVLKTTEGNTNPARLYDFAVSSDAYNQPSPTAFSLERRNRRWVTDSYTIDFNNWNNYDQDRFTTQPQNVVFDEYTAGGYEGGGWGNRRYWKYIGGYNNYYEDGSFTITAPHSLEDSRITGITMSYYSGYNQQAVTVEGDVSRSRTLTGNKTSWSSTSTGDGNGDNTVTVTMSCSSWNQYNNRNRLTSLTVNYGYWSEE